MVNLIDFKGDLEPTASSITLRSLIPSSVIILLGGDWGQLHIIKGLKIPQIQGKPTDRGSAVALVNSEKEDIAFQESIQEKIDEGTIEKSSEKLQIVGLSIATRLQLILKWTTVELPKKQFNTTIQDHYRYEICLFTHLDGDKIQEMARYQKSKKSKLILAHRFAYLGIDWDSISMKVQLIGKKINKAKMMVRDRIRQTLKGVQTTAHTISKIVGILQSLSICESQTFVRTRSLITIKERIVTENGQNDSVLLDSDQMEELLWWDVRLRNPLEYNLDLFVVYTIITSDASYDDLGATLMIDNNKFAAQKTNECFQTMTSNAWEMLAIQFSLEEFTETPRYFNIEKILIQMNNQTCFTDIQKRSSYSLHKQILVQFIDQSGRNNWRLQFQWIPGVLNTIADKLSRGTNRSILHTQSKQSKYYVAWDANLLKKYWNKNFPDQQFNWIQWQAKVASLLIHIHSLRFDKMEKIKIGSINLIRQGIIIQFETRLKKSNQSKKIYLRSLHEDIRHNMLYDALEQLKLYVSNIHFVGGPAVPLFVNQAGNGTLTAVQIAQLVMNTKKLAGINTDYFMGYSAKASDISTRYLKEQSISDEANQSRLSKKSGILQNHYLKQLQKIKRQTSYTNISSSKFSHSPREARPAIITSKPSPEQSSSVDTDETNDANDPPQKWNFREKHKISIQIRFQD
ncbi:MAG: hypothetical protein EZS28_009572 [Streblomastix strix]|uniref:Uncharacterized protein n=1 Tax=Streblomastix strix TaxID=222440 RepID=A0A5J4WJH7_9EUKA|nr:MAG: hypothetical protein EZS28_009572 [Streblomastix strix]